MAIKPILFHTEMVRAILEGRKSCTRRLVKPQPDGKHTFPLGFVTDSTEKKEVGCFGFGIDECGGSIKYVKPPYQPGDILYVRETWERFECWNCDGDERGNCPKEPKKSVLNKTCGCYMYRATDEISGDAKWHPSIHMPKEAARIWLKVTNVRVERLQECGEGWCIDIEKEGKDIMIGFNPKFLIDALRVIDDETVTIYLVNPKAPCFIRDDEENYTYLILPVNINQNQGR